MAIPLNTPTKTLCSHHIRLQGDWLVCPVSLDGQFSPRDFSWDNGITVPECSHLQPALYPDRPYWGAHLREINQRAWVYQRAFIPPDLDYTRARLHFGGVDYFAAVWLNNDYIGEHEGHFNPFTFDITQRLQPDTENTLVVRVSSPWDTPNPSGTYPSDHVIRGLVKGLYEHGEGVIPPNVNPLGIWRPVWLMLDQGISIDHVRLRTGLDGSIELRFTFTNATGNDWEGDLHLDVAAENHTGTGLIERIPIKLSPGVQHLEYTLHLVEPRLWWPWDQGEPNLYRLTACLTDTDRTLTRWCEVFGIRTVHLERSPARFTYYINERPVFLRGSSYMPTLYLSQASPETFNRDLALARQANLNLLRVHVHVSPPELYELCDRAGMLVWQDFELSWIQDSSPAFERRARILQREMISLLGNHPCIVTWSCHNEPTMVFARRDNLEKRPDPALYTDALAQDSTRPVFICSGQYEDSWMRSGDSHSYYGALWTKHYTDIYQHRFRLNTEFGFESPAAQNTLRLYPECWERLRHLDQQITELWTYQAQLIQYHVEHLRRLRATCCAGYIHFWLVDLVPQVGCGVLDAQRLPKGGYEALQRASQPLLVALEHDGHRPRALWIFNDTQQSYLNVKLHTRVHDAMDNVIWETWLPCTVQANASQCVAVLPWHLSTKQWVRVYMALIDEDSSVLVENLYQHPFQPDDRPAGYPWSFDEFLGTKVFVRDGASNLADLTTNPLFKMIPLSLREAIAEWGLRQRLPSWLLSLTAYLADGLGRDKRTVVEDIQHNNEVLFRN